MRFTDGDLAVLKRALEHEREQLGYGLQQGDSQWTPDNKREWPRKLKAVQSTYTKVLREQAYRKRVARHLYPTF